MYGNIFDMFKEFPDLLRKTGKTNFDSPFEDRVALQGGERCG
jgi:hypothetical protein